MSFPRIRGDVPIACDNPDDLQVFSPHTRGCSVQDFARPIRLGVFPAYAGMFRHQCEVQRRDHRFPRIRGDVPALRRGLAQIPKFSPHTRGCSP